MVNFFSSPATGKSKVFSKDTVNTTRQPELDILKGIAIILMIVEHCFLYLVNYADYPVFAFASDYLCQLLNASVFMIAMGITVLYSRKSTADSLAKRGLLILFFGQFLSLLRSGFPNIIGYFLTQSDYYLNNMACVVSGDIMQFAGLAFLLMALLKKCKLSGTQIFLTGVALNIVGCLLSGLNTGSYFVDQLLGFFYPTDTESYFPLFNWFIFPAFGMMLGEAYLHIKDKVAFFKRVFAICLPVSAAYFTLRYTVQIPFFYDLTDLNAVIRMNLIDSVAFICLDMLLICFSYLIYLCCKCRVPRFLGFVSQNINSFYCVSWTIILFVELSMLLCTGDHINDLYVGVAVTVGIEILTALCVLAYKRFTEKHPIKINSKAWTAIVIVILVTTVAVAIFAFTSAPEPANYLNEYSADLLPIPIK